MKLREFYEFSVQKGIEVDLRGREGIAKYLADVKVECEKLSGKEKEAFDTERLRNPFGDTRIVCGDPETEIRRMLVGIEIFGQEMLLAAELGRRGRPIDLIFGHHNTCLARPTAHAGDIMYLQIIMLVEAGVPIHQAEKIINADTATHERPENYQHPAIAELLGQAVIGIHSPCDNYMMYHLRKLVADQKPHKVGELVEILEKIPECTVAAKAGTSHPPKALVGGAKDSLGKLYYCLTGGWNPTPAAFRKIAEAGVGTAVMVAASADHTKIANEFQMNIVRFPHFPADSLGMNLLLDDARKRRPFEVVACSNFTRVERQ